METRITPEQIARCPLCSWNLRRAASPPLHERAWRVAVVAKHLREEHGNRIGKA